MAARPTWKGFLKVSLISVPVRTYSAAAAGHGEIHFHQIHAKCGSRIRHQKVCPIHGEVTKEELVSGYERAKDQYIVVQPEELEGLRTESDRAITIQAFIYPDALDPVYYSDRKYYLVPDGPAGQKPFSVLHRIMAEINRYAVARVVFAGREEIVLLRPFGRLLLMTMLNYETQLKRPSAYEDEVTTPKASPEELKLARSLIEANTVQDFDFSAYKDLYTARLAQLIDAKAAGTRIPPRPREKHTAIINFRDALSQSVERAETKQAVVVQGRRSRRSPRRKTG
jgi:DNA end-binding protein Ku